MPVREGRGRERDLRHPCSVFFHCHSELCFLVSAWVTTVTLLVSRTDVNEFIHQCPGLFYRLNSKIVVFITISLPSGKLMSKMVAGVVLGKSPMCYLENWDLYSPSQGSSCSKGHVHIAACLVSELEKPWFKLKFSVRSLHDLCNFTI